MDRRTLTMNWDGLGQDDDDDRFFESLGRISSAVPLDLASSGSDDDEEFEDSRLSFVSCISSKSYASISNYRDLDTVANSSPMLVDYGLWMAEPGDINERRKRLLQGMGLSSNKNLLKIASAKIVRAVSRKNDTPQVSSTAKHESSSHSQDESKQETPDSTPILLVRSRSDGDIETFSANTKKRKEEMIGPVSKQRLTRTSSVLITAQSGLFPYANPVKVSPRKITCRSSNNSGLLSSMFAEGGFGSFFLIKNLDTGKEFIVKESNEQGMWNKLSDVQTGQQLTLEEFEKSVGYSPVVKELMRRENDMDDESRKVSVNSYLSKSFRYSKRRGVSLLKNIRGVANSMSGLIADKERELPSAVVDQKTSKDSSQWVKVRQTGKSCKEFTALHLCQEIPAHEGSIWTIKFSTDARYLASAGEDGVIHIWEVQECEVMTTKPPDDLSPVSSTPVHPMSANAIERPPLADITPLPSERKKKGKHTSKKKGNSVPDYAHVPETVFALSEKPICTFTGHLDDVLDLSWSRYQLLLSSSMDKTVRLWDMETKSCLKFFAHNDYVTCIDFNPVDDDYFISGSLDSKARIWNIPYRQVVDWADLHEMVTAACYTPDGQGAIIGSHKGSCRSYSITDYKLEQKDQIEFKKSQAKKVTGLQFAPWNPAELLVTCADSRIRILEGSDVTHKFKGFRNTSSQISAAFNPEGKYIISASEDNQVYIWKHEDPKGKSRVTIQSHEHFQCRDVSVAIPWPGTIKQEPLVEVHSKRNSKRGTLPPQSAGLSPTKEENNGMANSRMHLPPLPKKKKNNNDILERSTSCAEDNFDNSSRIDSGIGITESFTSACPSFRYGDSPSISASSTSGSQSWSSSWGIFDGGNSNGSHTVQATAWGSVIVAATLGGEIRVYQNFGLPVKAGRQTNLFRDLT
ncbi:hypothetical protein ACH5RR_005343 [Cinchona calisaya]|uniref:WD repeat-containing protein 44 n=1 Tax=Cinchona calisaya TaxID=153742 RepID=A0ABD3AKY3_9GENT